MGIIINPSRGVTQYASINRNGIYISKLSGMELETDANGELVRDADGDAIIKNAYVGTGYVISCLFTVWNDQTAYRDRDTTNISHTVNVEVTTQTAPTNPYELLYTKFKASLPAHTDDI